MHRYVFRNEFQTFKGAASANPDVIGLALEKIDATVGRLTPADVVEVAKDEAHPLHPHFEWDDRKAAHAFRLDQARAIIRSVRLVAPDGAETPQAFVSIDAGEGRSYRPIDVVLRSPELQFAALKAAKKDLEAFRARYRQFEDICSVISDAIKTVDGRLASPAA